MNDVHELSERGVLYLEVPDNSQSGLNDILSGSTQSEDDKVMIGFPLPSDHFAAGGLVNNSNTQNAHSQKLHGSTKAAAKRRLSALKKSFKIGKKSAVDATTASSTVANDEPEGERSNTQNTDSTCGLNPELLDGMVNTDKFQEYSVKEQHQRQKRLQEAGSHNQSQEAKKAISELEEFFDRGGKPNNTNNVSAIKDIKNSFVLPKQAAYAGSREKRQALFSFLPQHHVESIPIEIRDAFGLQLTEDGIVEGKSVAYQALDAHQGSTARRKLYSHQAEAIEASLNDEHTLICTGTGSGKSLCFLLPILSRVMKSDMDASSLDHSMEVTGASSVALLIFPTKALANDQLTKLNSIIKSHPLLEKHIRPGIIDGDTPHSTRGEIANQCNILLSNPDTLHAAILPGWKATYKNFLARLHYIVIDELHIYEGAFGAHVSLVLRRLIRLAKVANCISEYPLPENKLVFIGCSATIGHPEEHFRLVCPIAKNENIKVLAPDEDGSPCAAKVRFVIKRARFDML